MENTETNKPLDLKQKLASLYSYLSKQLDIKELPKVIFTKDEKNSDEDFGFTGNYDHTKKLIRIYITNRHDTDILRSFAHEVIHHWQNLHGTLHPEEGGQTLPTSHGNAPHYAQTNTNLRKREMEAYLFGNILFRDWQDEQRNGPPQVPPFMPPPINENFQVSPDRLRQSVKKFVQELVTDSVFVAYHRERTSGDMNPTDFADDLVHKILSAIEKWVQTVNDRGNWENQSNMIK